MSKMNKQSFMVISAALIIVGLIILLIGGFGYTAAAKGEQTASILLGYDTDFDSIDLKAMKSEIAGLAGENPTRVVAAVDGVYALPALNVSFKLNASPDYEAIFNGLKSAHSEITFYSYSQHVSGPSFVKTTVFGLIGKAFIPAVVMILAVLVIRKAKFAGLTAGAMIHNMFLVLALEGILRLPGEQYILASMLLAGFVTVYASMRNTQNSGSPVEALKKELPVICTSAVFGLIFVAVSLVCGAPVLAAYGVALALAFIVPFYTDAVFFRN